MATKVVMAQLSPTMEEGKLVEWKVKEGDEVSQGDVLAEVETDKANMDIEAMTGGTVRALLISEGDVVEVGALIGVLGDPDEDVSELVDGAKPKDVGEAEEEEPEAEEESVKAEDGEEAGPEAAEPEDDAETTTGTKPRTGRVKVSPLARRMAEDAGLDIARIEGSGPGGRVVKSDVQAAIDAGGAEAQAEAGASGQAAPERAAAPTAALRPARLGDERIEASQMRKTIAKRLVQSIGPVPHFFLTTEIDMGRALDLRKALNERLSASGVKVGVNDLLVKVAAEALARHPEINASWDEDAVQRHGSADIGIAVAVPDGLITPVVREADRKGLAQIATEASDLIERARNRKLKPEEYTGATFSISNLGMFGIDEFTAIINPPEAAILAVGQTAERPVVEGGEIVVRRRMRVTMSCDHRVIDGATGAAFLQTYRAMLENPLELVS
ncbi:MAG TPA: pyruvate dehydrogenase complex dihydrolipoamide acetyltransferase [Gemmatimonadota bacterium]|nr:pyruvate dehydrogenase complex dihydrolipoamide acetyltransferase [Gemmatimonadota bacterium]